MKRIPTAIPSATSAPVYYGNGTGDGSIIAAAIGRGATVSRHTSDGTIRPFGQTVNSADDATVLGEQRSTSCALSSSETSALSD